MEYLFGLAKNVRSKRAIGAQMQQACVDYQQTGAASRVFADLRYRTRKSWSRERRIVVHLATGYPYQQLFRRSLLRIQTAFP